MTTRPWFKFYPKDWRGHTKLRLCSWAARGAWIEFMCLAHDSDEYGILRWTKKQIARAIGCPPRLIAELVKCGVIYGTESGMCEPMVFVPKSGRKNGDPVTLIEAQKGPIFYSPRMVKDEYLRDIRAASLPDDAPHDRRPNPPPNPPPDPSPMGRKGEGSNAHLTPHPTTHPRIHPHTGTESESEYRERTSSEASAIDPALREQARALVVEVARQLREVGMTDVHPHRPELIEALAQGVTGPELTATARELTAKDRPPKLNYLLRTVLGRRDDLANGARASPPRRNVTDDLADARYEGTPADAIPAELRR